MNDRELEGRLRSATARATPDVLDSVIKQCRQFGADRQARRAETKPHRRRIMHWAAAAAALVLVLVGVTGYGQYSARYGVAAVVELDVNPSIVLKVNRLERVLEVNPLNSDATSMLEGMDLRNVDVKVAVNAIVGSMLRHGYLSELANSILVTVESNDPEKGTALQQRIAQEISSLLAATKISPAVLSQTVTAVSDVDSIVKTYLITRGKAVLIQAIADQSELLAVKDLVGLTINDLNLLVESKKMDLAKVESTGSASDKAYIGAIAARDIAFADAGINRDKVTDLEVELDTDDGLIVYEIEFVVEGCEYEYEIDAKSGAILSKEMDDDDDSDDDDSGANPPAGSDADATDIGALRAMEIAFEHARVDQSKVRDVEVEQDDDEGRLVYEVEFSSGKTEYEYEVDARTGEIIRFEIETDD